LHPVQQNFFHIDEAVFRGDRSRLEKAAAEIESRCHLHQVPWAVNSYAASAAGLSFFHKFLRAATPRWQGLARLGIGTAAMGLGIGAFDWRSASREQALARRIGDGEGDSRAAVKIAYGQCETGASAFFLASQGCQLWPGAAGLLGMGAYAFSGAASFIGLVLSSIGLWRCRDFQEKVESCLHRPDLTPEERVAAALSYLEELISVTPQERSDLEGKIGQIENLVRRKASCLKRRSSSCALRLILDGSEKIARKIADPATRGAGIREGQALVLRVLRESRIKTAIHAAGFAASLLGLAALIAGIICASALLPVSLLIASATLWLALAIYNLVAPIFAPPLLTRAVNK
jgi:hypothetical protein